ncbi:membrane protein insertion efficiency factor YidD [Massilia scottii]|uniref:membrane protein insertion efficiency factor YidD n=1 Tax=Massilia scottii TaxID=3057166 RepID=UPI0027968C20|nr:membrane protein insertion efficiency factor YidD [Massilia sp. CCM 9029]MDQ1834004.1 membrane protein insertion efficiency factor YidD [Massilia sp. CCM 9029]
MMKTLALTAIGFYQRHLSPYKGFRCAYCAYTGNASCSALGARAIRRYGVWDGLGVLQGRLQKCGIAYRRYRPSVPSAPRLLARPNQAGECDLPCDCSCGLFSSGNACDMASYCVDAKDCWDAVRGRREPRQEEELIYIPPRSDPDNERS